MPESYKKRKGSGKLNHFTEKETEAQKGNTASVVLVQLHPTVLGVTPAD